jgi:anti-sigma-K factor RskA
MSDEQRELAGVYALGVLTGEELRRARALLQSDQSFRAEVAYWTGRLTPMLDEVADAQPPNQLWRRIAASLPVAADSTNVVQLNQRVTLWRSVSAAMTAVAAGLALVLLFRPEAVVRPVGPPMVAMLGDQQKQMRVMASWNPNGRQLVLAAAGDMPSDPKHSHELWIIPSGGKPRSLGTMPGKQMHMQLADALAELMREGATIAITVEPPGGSPTGDPTGPVVASGKLENS